MNTIAVNYINIICNYIYMHINYICNYLQLQIGKDKRMQKG